MDPRRQRRRWAARLTLCLVLGATAADATPGRTADAGLPRSPARPGALGAGPWAAPLRLGLVLSANDPLAASRLAGASLAVEQLAARGGPRAELFLGDDSGRWSGAAEAARELLFERDCGGLIAPPDGNAAHLVEQLAARTRVPVVLLGGAGSLTRVPLPLVRRVGPDDRAQLAALIATLDPAGAGQRGRSDTTRERIVCLLPAGAAGRRASEDLAAVGRQLDLALMPLPLIDAGELLPLLARERVARDEPLILWLETPSVQRAVATLSAAGWSGPLLLPQRAVEGCWAPEPPGSGIDLRALRLLSTDPDRQQRAFAEAFRLVYGHAPDEAAAFAFDAALTLASLLSSTSTDPGSWARSTTGPDHGTTADASLLTSSATRAPAPRGVSGSLLFDRRGERRRRFEPWRSRIPGATRPAPPTPPHLGS